MRSRIIATVSAAILSLCTVSCIMDDFEKGFWDGTYDEVFIYWAGGVNNLYSYLDADITDLCNSDLPDIAEHKAVLVLSHLAVDGNYGPAPTYMIKLHRKNGIPIRDTVRTYGPEHSETDPEFFRSVLNDIREDYPSEHYGMLFSSHGTSFLPEGYFKTYPSYGKSSGTSTNSLGCTYVGSDYTEELDIKDLPGAFPMHMDYILMDACFMGSVEVAYQLRNTCKYLVASPTEILSEGFCYKTLIQRLFRENHDMEMICRDYMDQSNRQDATISLIDCKAMDDLAVSVSVLAARYSSEFETINRSKDNLQRYFRHDSHWFYDLRDIFRAAGASDAELSELDLAMQKCILYKDHSDSFLSSFTIERFCGLSMYLPLSSFKELNSYYKSLDWNMACRLVQ